MVKFPKSEYDNKMHNEAWSFKTRQVHCYKKIGFIAFSATFILNMESLKNQLNSFLLLVIEDYTIYCKFSQNKT